MAVFHPTFAKMVVKFTQPFFCGQTKIFRWKAFASRGVCCLVHCRSSCLTPTTAGVWHLTSGWLGSYLVTPPKAWWWAWWWWWWWWRRRRRRWWWWWRRRRWWWWWRFDLIWFHSDFVWQFSISRIPSATWLIWFIATLPTKSTRPHWLHEPASCG